MQVVFDILGLLLTAGLWQTVLARSVLFLLPALGGTVSERSGVVNIAMEGLMIIGGFVAAVTDLTWHNPWLATLAAVVAGGLLALIHAIISIRFRADQIISGFAVNIFAAGLTTFLIFKIFGHGGGTDHVAQDALLPTVNVPFLKDIPFIGQVLFQQNVIVYVALLILVLVHIVLFRTRLGLRIRAVGEHPQAADTAGINVQRLRYGAVITSGLFSALAGAFLCIGVVTSFDVGITSGRGYIALAAMIFGKWTPLGAFIACIVFGLGDAITAYTSTIAIPPDLLHMLPYVLTLVVLAGIVGRSTPPAADGLPYEPGVE
jgi:simple sugar transport system permease protein